MTGEARQVGISLDATAALEHYRMAYQPCEEHEPSGGARSGCVICGLIDLNRAISRIDYALGRQNEMGVSLYDVDVSEERVIALAERYRKALEDIYDRSIIQSSSYARDISIIAKRTLRGGPPNGS